MSDLCFNCGQELPKTIDPFNVLELRNAVIDSDIVWQDTIEEQSLDIQGMPQEAVITVISADVESEFDSYGDAIGSGFVVFEIRYNGQKQNFKINGSQSSYGGWEWDESFITKVAARPKTVLVWENVNG